MAKKDGGLAVSTRVKLTVDAGIIENLERTGRFIGTVPCGTEGEYLATWVSVVRPCKAVREEMREWIMVKVPGGIAPVGPNQYEVL
jgi:hypothetical protein